MVKTKVHVIISKGKQYEIPHYVIGEAIYQAKKEVFDDIESILSLIPYAKDNVALNSFYSECIKIKIKHLTPNSKKVTLWCSEHGDQEGNVCKKCLSANSKTKPQCKFLYADWCHNPTVGQQEKCFFYHNNHNCKHYATNSKKQKDVSEK